MSKRLSENCFKIWLPRFNCFEFRLRRQQPIIKILIRTSEIPETMPTINNVPDKMLPVEFVLRVGKPPNDDAGCSVGGISSIEIEYFIEI